MAHVHEGWLVLTRKRKPLVVYVSHLVKEVTIYSKWSKTHRWSGFDGLIGYREKNLLHIQSQKDAVYMVCIILVVIRQQSNQASWVQLTGHVQ